MNNPLVCQKANLFMLKTVFFVYDLLKIRNIQATTIRSDTNLYVNEILIR